MRYLFHLIKLLMLGIAVAAIAGCGSSSSGDDASGDAPVITADVAVVTFQTQGMPDVIFNHKTHGDTYMNGNCMICHQHTNVRDTSIWDCGQCHAEDTSRQEDQNCFDPTTPEHACWMVQCRNCHATVTPAPTPDCVDCHM